MSCLAVHFRYLAQVLDAYGNRCPKTDYLSENWCNRTLVEYRENATSLQGHIRFAISTWVGLHPISVLPI